MVPAAKKGARPKEREAVSVEEVVAWLERTGTKATVEGMMRYGIPNDKPFGKWDATSSGLAATAA